MTKKDKVFQIVSQIPRGKVATYGQIARMIDSGPRVIGQYLHQNTDPETTPCHRVVHSDGSLAAGYVFGGEGKQKEILHSEGVIFEKNKINLVRFGWSLK